MATSMSPAKNKPAFTLPMPPPPLHTRSGNTIYGDAPHTPTSAAFTSPYSTPQGSPSKSKLPPGAHELPQAFENAMSFDSSVISKGRQQLGLHSPNKITKQAVEDTTDEGSHRPFSVIGPGSPARKLGKENTPPGIVHSKPSTPNQAAVSRQEPYQTKDTESGIKVRYNPQRGLTPEELEKLQLPKVKRLANVTQLCKFAGFISEDSWLTALRLPRPLFRSP